MRDTACLGITFTGLWGPRTTERPGRTCTGHMYGRTVVTQNTPQRITGDMPLIETWTIHLGEGIQPLRPLLAIMEEPREETGEALQQQEEKQRVPPGGQWMLQEQQNLRPLAAENSR